MSIKAPGRGQGRVQSKPLERRGQPRGWGGVHRLLPQRPVRRGLARLQNPAALWDPKRNKITFREKKMEGRGALFYGSHHFPF